MKRPWPVQLWHAVREERNGKMTDDLFERAPVPRAYFKLALPVVFSMVISLVYNMVDTFFYRPDTEYQHCSGSVPVRACFYTDDSPGRYFRFGRQLRDFQAVRSEKGRGREKSKRLLLLCGDSVRGSSLGVHAAVSDADPASAGSG